MPSGLKWNFGCLSPFTKKVHFTTIILEKSGCWIFSKEMLNEERARDETNKQYLWKFTNIFFVFQHICYDETLLVVD